LFVNQVLPQLNSLDLSSFSFIYFQISSSTSTQLLLLNVCGTEWPLESTRSLTLLVP